MMYKRMGMMKRNPVTGMMYKPLVMMMKRDPEHDVQTSGDDET